MFVTQRKLFLLFYILCVLQLLEIQMTFDVFPAKWKLTGLELSCLQRQMTISFVRSDSRELYDFKGQEWYVKLVVHSIDVEDGKHAQNALVRAPVSRPNMLPFASNHEW